jgi:outer membrane receptor protein involved in Fe transport
MRHTALALACLPVALPLSVMAQERERAVEEVVVTGSLIRGTPEDAALPVEIFTAADLQELGDPSPLEFVKSLSISGPTTGEAYYFSGSGNTNNVRFNLRGLGSDKTLTLFNGRRAFQNSVVYPSGAVERIEVLKDGAAVTYGADATGGVVNVITRDKFDGFEASTSYKTYDGSDQGEWKLGAVAGFNTETSNLLFAVEWDHRSELHSYDRDFANRPYAVNPAPASTLTNLASWLPRQAMPSGAPRLIPGDTFNSGEWGAPSAPLISDFTQSSCEAVGGVFVPGASNNNSCAYNYIPYYNLVEENDVYRVYAQLTTKISENSDFHLRALWAANNSPTQYGSPSQPVIRGPALTTGATYQLYVPAVNPFVADLRANSGFAGGAAGYTPVTYRAFAHGGNDAMASGDNHSTPNSNETKYWHINGGFTGTIGDSVNYDVSGTFNQFKSVNSQPDLLGFRMQDALNGFGGPNCNAVDADPTKFGIQATSTPAADTGARPAGCLWYNPFASNFAGQPAFGLGNPAYNANSQNSVELIRWLFNKREFEDNHYDFTFDAVFSGDLPIELPGGNIGWGVGGQYRDQQNRETVNDPLYNGQTPCDWPGQDPRASTDPLFTGCTLDEAGPYLFFANNPPDSSHQIQQSYFAELAFPILDSLNFTAAGRYEKFEPIGLDATVYKVSAKWQVVDQFALRGSYGTNYQAPFVDGASNRAIIPGDMFNTVASYTRAGGAWLGSQQFTRDDIKPETATVWNVGAILQFSFGSTQDLQVTLDYFNIETEDELGLVASTNDIANSVFSAATGNFANCSHPLIGRVTFNSPCVQGVTTARDFASIRTDYGNGPGQQTTGVDFQVNYGVGAGPGKLSLGLAVTKQLKNDLSETTLDGFVVKAPDDRLGYLNYATVGFTQSEWRGNFNVNYAVGDHNIRAVYNYVSGVDDERYFNPDGSLNTALLTPSGRQPGTNLPFNVSTFGVYGEDWKTIDLHYLWRASWATLGASIINAGDEDPPASRQEMGYDPRIGSPLGRQFEVSLRKSF